MEQTKSTPVSPHASVQLASVDLLYRLESSLDTIRRLRKKGNAIERIDAATLMLLEVLGFTDAYLDEQALAQLNPRIQHIYDLTRELDQKISTEGWRVSRLFLRDSPASDETIAASNQLRDEYSKLFVEFFVKCVEHFDCSKAEKVSFLKTVDAFVIELVQVW